MTNATQQATAKSNDVSSNHSFRAYITKVDLVTPKPEKGQKKDPVPYYTVQATLHNGRTSDKKLKYIYANKLYVTKDVLDLVEDVYMQQQQAEDKKVNVACVLEMQNISAHPYVSKGTQMRVNWGGTITALELNGEKQNEGAQ